MALKSEFLKKLSDLLIPDKETDYIDVYQLQNIANWPMFTIVQYDSEDGEINNSIKVEMPTPDQLENLEYWGFEFSQLISFNEKQLIIDTGGEWQGLNRVIIELDNNGELFVVSCQTVPDLSDGSDLEKRMNEEEYEKLLDDLQNILENQD